MKTYFISQCIRPACRFRYPLHNKPDYEVLCPKCGTPTRVSTFSEEIDDSSNFYEILPGPVIEVLFDNIRSSYNVGSMLRTSDAAGISFIHICGITPTPDHSKVKKTALGSQFLTRWAQYWDGLQTIKDIRSRGFLVWGLEVSGCSMPITDAIRMENEKPILLIVGNEISGIDPEIRDCCDKLVEIPMHGHKESLNVAVAFSVAVYLIRYLSKYKGY